MEEKIQLIKQLSLVESDPIKKSVYDSLLSAPEERLQKTVLLEIIRANSILLNQNVVLKSFIISGIQAYIQVYNTLYLGKYKLLEYIPHFFLEKEVDSVEEIVFNETICINTDDNLYYLCDCGLLPMTCGYKTIEELYNKHGLS